MEYNGQYTLQSLADARSKVCGFRIFEAEDVIELSAEWSHSLNMLNIDISAIYQEVCATMTPETQDNMGAVDMIISCDKTQITIAFLGNLRNRTGYKCLDSRAKFYGMEGHPLSGIVVDACVWANIIHDPMHVLLHLDKTSTSCWFRFMELPDPEYSNLSSFFKLIKNTVPCLAIIVLILALIPLYAGFVWMSVREGICLHIFPILNLQPESLWYCRGLVDSTHNEG